MGRKEEAKSATSALHRYVDIIDDACSMSRGQIADVPEHDPVIRSLQKNNLAYFVDNAMGIQVHSTVRRLLNHVTKKYRLRETHQAFAGMIEELHYAIQSYQVAKNKHQDDKLLYQDQIHELTLDIMDALADTVASFSIVVGNEFSTISNIDIRIRETTRSKEEISKLNSVFGALSVTEIREWVGADLMLERLLMKTLKGHVDKCLRDLSSTAQRLLEMIAKLVKDKEAQRLNQLIDSLYAHYQKNPGYAPTLDPVIDLPPAFNCVSPIKLSSFADLDSATDEETLSELAIAATQSASRSRIEQKETEVVAVSDDRQKTLEAEIDQFDENIDFFFAALRAETSDITELTAMRGFEILDVDADSEDWMLSLMEYYEAQKTELSCKIKVSVTERVLDPFNGNHLVSDITFSRLDNV